MFSFFKKHNVEVRTIKTFAGIFAALPAIWSLVDLSKGDYTNALVKTIFFIIAGTEYAFGYMIGDLKPKLACKLPHMPATTKYGVELLEISRNQNSEKEEEKEPGSPTASIKNKI